MQCGVNIFIMRANNFNGPIYKYKICTQIRNGDKIIENGMIWVKINLHGEYGTRVINMRTERWIYQNNIYKWLVWTDREVLDCYDDYKHIKGTIKSTATMLSIIWKHNSQLYIRQLLTSHFNVVYCKDIRFLQVKSTE